MKSQNMTKVPSHVMLVLANVTKELSIVRERKKEEEKEESLNVTKVPLHMMLVLSSDDLTIKYQ